MADVRKEMRTQRFTDTYNNAKKVPGASNSPSATAAMQAQKQKNVASKKVPGASNSPSATAAMQAQKQKNAVSKKVPGASNSPSATAAMQAQKNADAANQNQLLQAMLNNRQTEAIKNRQTSELAVNATIYEKYLAGYNKLVNRLSNDAKDTYSKQQVQASIDEYIAQLDNPKSEVTRDGLTQYLAYTNQTEKYRALLLANPSVDVHNTNNAHMNNSRRSESMYIDYAVPSGSTAGIDEKQIANISSAQEAYKLSVDLARQINAIVPDAITTGVIGYEGNAVTGEKTPIYGYIVAKNNVKVAQLTNLLSATNKQLVKLLDKETKADSKTLKTLGADNISNYSGTVSNTNIDVKKVANNLVAAQYKAFYLQNKYNADLAMYGAPEGYDFEKDPSATAQRIIKEYNDMTAAQQIADNMASNIEQLQLDKESKRVLYYTYYTAVSTYFGRYMTPENQEKIAAEIVKYSGSDPTKPKTLYDKYSGIAKDIIEGNKE